MSSVAFFDFDGTITTRDTLFEFIRFYHGSLKFYFGMVLLAPYLVAHKSGVLSSQRTKETVLRYFFNGVAKEKFDQKCVDFTRDRLPEIVRPKAVDRISWHLQQKHDVLIVSASPENWIQPWANQFGIKVIGTKLNFSEHRFTGIKGKNCNHHEKVVRIKNHLDLDLFDKVFAYGDTSGDEEMLALADDSLFKPFRARP